MAFLSKSENKIVSIQKFVTETVQKYVLLKKIQFDEQLLHITNGEHSNKVVKGI